MTFVICPQKQSHNACLQGNAGVWTGLVPDSVFWQFWTWKSETRSEQENPLTRSSLTEQVESAEQNDLVQVENPVYQLCRESVCGENLLSRLESQRV